MDQDATWYGVGPGEIVLNGDPAPLKRGTAPPLFGPCLLWPNAERSPISATAKHLICFKLIDYVMHLCSSWHAVIFEDGDDYDELMTMIIMMLHCASMINADGKYDQGRFSMSMFLVCRHCIAFEALVLIMYFFLGIQALLLVCA